MDLSSRTRRLLQRGAAAVLVVLVAPLLLTLASIAENAPVVAGEPAPRTIVASEQVQVRDEEATTEAEQQAASSVADVYNLDRQAQAEIVQQTRAVFDAIEAAREPETVAGASPGTTTRAEPSRQVQIQQLQNEIGGLLSTEAIRTVVGLTDSELATLRNETIGAASQLARLQIRPDEVQAILDQQLPTELAVRSFPGETASVVAEPLLREVLRPTMTFDREATREARDDAAAEVEPVVRTYQQNEPIVREGQIVDEVDLRALSQLGLEGSDPQLAYLRGAAAMLAILLVAVGYLRRMQPRVWRSGRKLLLLAVLVAGYAAIVGAVGLLAQASSPGWWYAVPVGAMAMLAAILVHPVVGLASMLPGIVLVELTSPQSAGVPLYVAAVVLVSVPLVTALSSRSDLRAATLRTALLYPVLAGVAVLVFGPRDETLVAVAAGLANGLVTAMIVQGALPFLETSFRLPTVTALLDLADRNHPLLRELESKALGSYNHSVMVASLVERGCREIGANPLLGSVAALYHDIGKVRQPHFFIENQRGIANPHTDLEPEVSAIIIQNHVQDGVEMAREFRLPPEVVACIHSHHGTMLVTYFYREALDRAGGDIEKIDADHYRYKGSKPRSKEAAVLMMADCCEAATRSAAMDRGTLPREEIERMVDRLIQTRVDDGQFDRCELTFAEMSRVRDAIVEALVGIYHPRIAYPGDEAGPTVARDEPVEPPTTGASVPGGVRSGT